MSRKGETVILLLVSDTNSQIGRVNYFGLNFIIQSKHSTIDIQSAIQRLRNDLSRLVRDVTQTTLFITMSTRLRLPLPAR